MPRLAGCGSFTALMTGAAPFPTTPNCSGITHTVFQRRYLTKLFVPKIEFSIKFLDKEAASGHCECKDSTGHFYTGWRGRKVKGRRRRKTFRPDELT